MIVVRDPAVRVQLRDLYRRAVADFTTVDSFDGQAFTSPAMGGDRPGRT